MKAKRFQQKRKSVCASHKRYSRGIKKYTRVQRKEILVIKVASALKEIPVEETTQRSFQKFEKFQQQEAA